MEYVANSLYANTIDVQRTDNTSTATSSIDDKKCCYMAIYGSSTYKNHGVAVIGYHVYVKEIKFSESFSIVVPIIFYEIADGWNDKPIIFDPNTSANPKYEFCYLARC